MKALLLVIYITAASQLELKAQISIGPNVSTFFWYKQGVAMVDSIQVNVEDGARGIISPGLFINYAFPHRVSIRMEVNYFKNLWGPIVYNRYDNCQLCPVKKASTISSSSFEVPLTATYRIIEKPISVEAFVGINPVFNIRGENPDIGFNGKHPGVAEVMNVLDEVIKPVVVFYSVGLRLEYKNFGLQFRALHQQTPSSMEDINIRGTVFPFRVQDSYFNAGIFYKLFMFPG